MNSIIVLTIFTILFTQCKSLENQELIKRQTSKFGELLKKRLMDIWLRLQAKDESDTFIGRCLGAARRLKFVMPLIIFKLGVIITILAFLTLFSLKSLGLLFTLLLFNFSGYVSKLALLKAPQEISSHWSPPARQNVHLHVHQNKDGSLSPLGQLGPFDSWSDRTDLQLVNKEDDFETRLKLMNLINESHRK